MLLMPPEPFENLTIAVNDYVEKMVSDPNNSI